MDHTNLAGKKLTEHLALIDGAYAPNTLRAFRADFEEFIRFCEKLKCKALPAKPEAVAKFIDAVTEQKLASASIRRKIVSIGSIHRLLELPDPTKAGCVKLASRKMHRQLGRACKQAYPINKDVLERMLKVCVGVTTKDKTKALRDKVLLLMAYDTMTRRSELVSLKFEDIEPSQSYASIYLSKSKVDQEGAGRWLTISNKTLETILEWKELINTDNGFILRALYRDRVATHLGSAQISRILKRIAKRADLPGDICCKISGHSLRVGASQDWADKGISLPQLMVLGGWEKPDTAIRYIGKLRSRLENLPL